jgi:hypothetical protein
MIKPHARRLLLAEWLSLPKEKRMTKLQAIEFALKAVRRYPFKSNGEPYLEVVHWLSLHVGKR